MSNRRGPLKQPEFYAINRAIKNATEPVDFSIVAQTFGVSTQTVRAVHHAKTWPQYERNKQARHKRVTPERVDLPAGTGVVPAPPRPPRPSTETPPLTPSEIRKVRDLLDHFDALEEITTKQQAGADDLNDGSTKRSWNPLRRFK